MSGVYSRWPVQARCALLADLLNALRIQQEMIRTGDRISADAAMVRQNRVIDQLADLSGDMQAQGDFGMIKRLLSIGGQP
jgi:hypothetical protein